MFTDNKTKTLLSVFEKHAHTHDTIWIAVGSLNFEGLCLIIDTLMEYVDIRIIIGENPTIHSKISIDSPYVDLLEIESLVSKNVNKVEYYQAQASKIIQLLDSQKLKIKIYNHPSIRMHAKCYLWQNSSFIPNIVGSIGSSNLTKSGLKTNIEFNQLETRGDVLSFKSMTDNDPDGPIIWFDKLWRSENSLPWDEEFRQILATSSIGEEVFSPYEMYVKTLHEVFHSYKSDAIESVFPINLYPHQRNNARDLYQKLERHNFAILADSVGLGKTRTAVAVIKAYMEKKNFKRVVVLAPPKLLNHWEQELWNKEYQLLSSDDIISLKNRATIERVRKKYKEAKADINLFVIDESHHLRHENGQFYKLLSDWFYQDNPNSKLLFITATPINNSSEDILNQFKLAPSHQKTDYIPKLANLIKERKKIRKKGGNFDIIDSEIRGILRNFLVRTTRLSIQDLKFPKSKINNLEYAVTYDDCNQFVNSLDSLTQGAFNKINLDVLKTVKSAKSPLTAINRLISRFNLLKNNTLPNSALLNLLKSLCLLSLPDSNLKPYMHDYQKHQSKNRNLLKKMNDSRGLVRVLLLKRLESSIFAFQQSLNKLRSKSINIIQNIDASLEKNSVAFRNLNLDDSFSISPPNLYEDDVEDGRNEGDGIMIVSPRMFDCVAIKEELGKDVKIFDAMLELLEELRQQEDRKLNRLISVLSHSSKNDANHSNKFLIFSSFVDTIEYLHQKLIEHPDIDATKLACITSKTKKDDVSKYLDAFSPNSRNVKGQAESIDYLLSTEVLAEGQNLQDCNNLINYDLPWNPVRIMQRNGRINRLGSVYPQINIYNMIPESTIDYLLNLIEILGEKMETIAGIIGIDERVLGKESLRDLYGSNPLKNQEGYERITEGKSVQEDIFYRDYSKFIDNAQPQEKNRIFNIPFGKWGYMPLNALQNPPILSFLKYWHKQDNSWKFSFWECNDATKKIFSEIGEYTALEYLKTDDDRRSKDRIRDKNNIIKRIREDFYISLVSANSRIRPLIIRIEQIMHKFLRQPNSELLSKLLIRRSKIKLLWLFHRSSSRFKKIEDNKIDIATVREILAMDIKNTEIVETKSLYFVQNPSN
ncbi:MAG: helicase-related protein [Candidatus Saccharibacteria bacterium]|nr:helicase-related protein [Candidatus Saccharibacteria bacterium]